MGGKFCRERHPLQDSFDAGRTPEVALEIWSRVVDASRYGKAKYLNLQIENLIFEGGGTKGMAYVGAVKALHDLGILRNVKRFAGTSAGSYVAMKLCMYSDADDFLIGSLDNMEKIFLDSSKLKFPLNVLCKFGWHSGDGLLEYIRRDVKQATGSPDTTFYQWYKQSNGRELCVLITNVSTGCVEYCHPKTTPNMSIAEAVKISMSIPVLYQPHSNTDRRGHRQYFCDGGVMNNYPINVFDGWYLSMEKDDSFFHKLDQAHHPFSGRLNDKTLGMVLFNAFESEHFKEFYLKRYGDVLHGERPETALKKSREDRLANIAKEQAARESLIESTRAFLKQLAECDLDKTGDINIKELEKVVNDMKKDDVLRKHLENIFGTSDLDVGKLFQKADLDNNLVTTFSEWLQLLQNEGAPLRQILQTDAPADIKTMSCYLSSVFSAMSRQLRRLTEIPEDIDRTIGIYTDYIGTTDFDMSMEDKIYAIQQGWRAAVAYFDERFEREVTKGGSSVLDNEAECESVV